MSGVLGAQLAHAVVVAFLVVLQLLGGSEADAPSSGDRTTPRERERGQSRVWVPEDQLTLPVGWSWEQYIEGLLAKELDERVGAELLPTGWSWSAYHSNEEVGAMFAALERSCPAGLVRKYSIGSSEEGRPLHALQIGAYVADGPTSMLVPGVKLVGNMHGDEVAGKEMLVRLAWDVCRRFERSPDDGDDLGVTWMLRHTALHILPSLNPDGNAVRKRWNAKRKDLNRSFPRLGPTSTGGAVDTVLPAEVAAMIGWHRSNEFALSANLHGGALVASYPMDGCDPIGIETSCPTAEDPLPHRLAAIFANAHSRMSVMPGEPSFASGTVRGSEWYPVLGGMQDWVWHATSCLEITVEVHEMKERSDRLAARLPFLYLESRDALLEYVKQVHLSLKGRVMDASAVEDRPLDARVTLTAESSTPDYGAGRTTGVRATVGGSFVRLLIPGYAYCIKVEAEGFTPQLAAIRLPRDTEPSPTSALEWEVRMVRGGSPEVVLLGDASPGMCGSGDVVTPGEGGALQLSCQQTAVEHRPGGGIELECVNTCDSVEMESDPSSGGFIAKCIRAPAL